MAWPSLSATLGTILVGHGTWDMGVGSAVITDEGVRQLVIVALVADCIAIIAIISTCTHTYPVIYTISQEPICAFITL